MNRITKFKALASVSNTITNLGRSTPFPDPTGQTLPLTLALGVLKAQKKVEATNDPYVSINILPNLHQIVWPKVSTIVAGHYKVSSGPNTEFSHADRSQH